MSPRRADKRLRKEPRRVLVTGCAGFIGSHLAERLLDMGHDVLGVDCFTSFYSRSVKEANLAAARAHPNFEFRELDLGYRRVTGLLEDVDVVYHLAGQPGVRPSFGGGFKAYVRNNIHATQRLLEEASRNPVAAFAYASSSSVYGDGVGGASVEDDDLAPISPYAMSKLATEEIAKVYHRTRGVPVVGLRYFTVYGPRQRPDMAFARFFDAALHGRPLPVFGDGTQRREFTYIDDVVTGTLAAARRGVPGRAYNIGGGTTVALTDVIDRIDAIVGHPLEREYERAPRGDVHETRADGARSLYDLGYSPTVDLDDGLRRQYAAACGQLSLTTHTPQKEVA